MHLVHLEMMFAHGVPDLLVCPWRGFPETEANCFIDVLLRSKLERLAGLEPSPPALAGEDVNSPNFF